MKIKLITAVGLIFLLTSCGAPKDVVYFQGLDSLTPEQMAQMNQNYSSRISTDDLLTITVTAWDASVVTPFNPPVWSYASQGDVAVNTSAQQLHTYLVDSDGNINFPVLGKVHVAGLSKQELTVKMQGLIDHYVKDPLVNVQIVNYKVTVLGDVARPGSLTIRNERVTIIEAIGSMGDLNINANRKNILVVRDNNGMKEHGRVDITDPAIFASPYYYLRQNDLVYVEPNKVKQKNARYSQGESFNVSIVSAIISGISTATAIILAITRK
ncbi:polysaccharide biosynthesis protein [Bacteroidia bacterium]|nr:polysaccharide biosynthesis protein [Bacteroidia bacterium]